MVEEDLPSMKLGAMDFGSFDATQLVGKCVKCQLLQGKLGEQDGRSTN